MSEELIGTTEPSVDEQAVADWDRVGEQAVAESEQEAVIQAFEEEQAPPKQEENQGLLPNNPVQLAQEVATAAYGGATDAVESVGGFMELTGDTVKTGLNSLFGRPVDQTQNPFSSEYESNDQGFLNIPDEMIPENKSGLGHLARGLVEFGILAAATGGVGAGQASAAKTGQLLYRGARASGFGIKGARTIAFLPKGAVIAGEGAIADLISQSSEAANIANLVQEYAPWVPFAELLAIDPDKDNPWVARLKTMAAGSGINLVGHGLVAFARGAWAAGRAKIKGFSVDESNQIGNQAMADSMARDSALDEAAATERAADNWLQGRGVSNADPRAMYRSSYLDEAENARYNDPLTSEIELDELDEIADARGMEAGNPWDWEQGQSAQQFEDSLTRQVDSAVNPNLFPDSARSTYRPDADDPLKANVRESIQDMKMGGEGRSYNPLFTEAALNKMSRGDISIRQYIIEAGEDLAAEAFKSLDNTLDFKEVQALILRQAEELHSMLEDGGEAAVKQLRDYFARGDKDGIVWTHDGNTVSTGTATQKAALQLTINTLAKQAQAIASGAMNNANHVGITRQAEQVFEAMKVALIEHKKIGYMTGTELATQKGISLSPNRAREINRNLAEITQRQTEHTNALLALTKEGKHSQVKDLMELHQLSGGKVRTLEHIHEYLRALLKGGRMDGQNITGRWRTEARSVFYNSILSSLKTPVKAIAGTNLIGLLRPFQAYLGAGLKGNKTEMVIAAAQIDALGKAWAEGFDMFRHNWDLGVNRKAQSYVGKFDFEKDIDTWKSMSDYYRTYGSPQEQAAYSSLDWVVDLNNNPWMRYSQNGMGAGDALARTIIGRFEMRMRAARSAIESGVDLNDVSAWANKYEEAFRKDVFSQDQYGKWIVSDKAARLAGDEAAMTKALEGNLSGLENIARITGMRAFFPFVRTGFNALTLSFQHTELNRFSGKFHDIMNGQNLHKYGIRPEDLGQAQALMRGRMAMGNTIIGMSTIAAASGLMTGNYPADKESRDLWKANGIQPFSFRFPVGFNRWAYVSYRDIEPFNTLFAATANIISNSHVLGEDIRDDMLEKLVFMTTAVLVDKSMLAGVEDLAQVLSADGAGGKLQRTGAKYLRAHLPYAGLLAQVGGVMDANQKEANNFLEIIANRDAIFKSTMQPKYDILSKDRSGKKLIIGPEFPLLRLFNAMSPVAVTFPEGDPVKMTLKAMSYNLPETLSTFKGEPLNSYERSRLQYYMSTGDLRKRLEHVMNSPSFKKEFEAYKALGLRQADGYELYKQGWYQMVHRVFVNEKKIAMARLRADNPNLAARIEARAAKKRIGKEGSYGHVQYLINEFPK